MPLASMAAGTLLAVAGMFAWLSSGPTPFSPHACANVEHYLPAHVVGQELALRQLADAVCTHVARHQRPGRLAAEAPGAQQQQQQQAAAAAAAAIAIAAGPGARGESAADDSSSSSSSSSNDNLAERALSTLVRSGKRAARAAGAAVARQGDAALRRRRRRRAGAGASGGMGGGGGGEGPDPSRQHNSKPLVISVHGPPGVGKTLTHTLLARAIYGRGDPAVVAASGRLGGGGSSSSSGGGGGNDDPCPGRGCRGYRVFYGMDYLSSERAQRIDALRADLLSHLRQNPDAVVVVEEYDKLDCAARSMWRHLLQRPQDANVSTLHRAVVLLESNLGMSELEGMLTEGAGAAGAEEEAAAIGDGSGQDGGGGDGAAAAAAAAAVAAARERAEPEEAERRLRDAVFARWRRDGCEAYEDTLKLVSLVDFFLPYFPLERRHVDELIARALRERARAFALAAAEAADAAAAEAEEEEEEEAAGGRVQEPAADHTDAGRSCGEDTTEEDQQQGEEAWSELQAEVGTFWPPPPPPPPPRSCAQPPLAGRQPSVRLAWSPQVVRFLSGRVEFSGPFPLEGAKGVESAVTRHVARLLRRAAEALSAARRQRRRRRPAEAAAAAVAEPAEEAAAPDTLLLFVSPAGQELKAELMTAAEARARMEAEAARGGGAEEAG